MYSINKVFNLFVVFMSMTIIYICPCWHFFRFSYNDQLFYQSECAYPYQTEKKHCGEEKQIQI